MQNIGHTRIYLAKVKSTNSYAVDLDPEVRSHGLILYSYNQTAGRGQRDRRWESLPDQNLALSLLLTRDLPTLEEHYILSVIAALAVSDTVQYFIQNKTKIKWPNDIIVQDHKISGILIENSLAQDHLRQSVMGIGLNVLQTQWQQAPKATSLVEHMTEMPMLVEVTERLISSLDRLWQRYLAGEVAALWQEYNEMLYKGGNLKKGAESLLPLCVTEQGHLMAEDEWGQAAAYEHGTVSWEL